MVVIKKHNNVIPIDFGEFSFNFIATDDNISLLDEVTKELSNIKFNNETKIKEIKDLGKSYWTKLFGEEIYEKVLTFSDGSSVTVVLYLLQTLKGIDEEFGERNNEIAFSKYL